MLQCLDMATSAQFRPVLKNELDIFHPRSVQVTQTGYETIPLKPINNVDSYSKRLEFYHPGRGTDFTVILITRISI